jgi:hypothetical protein
VQILPCADVDCLPYRDRASVMRLGDCGGARTRVHHYAPKIGARRLLDLATH